MSTFKDLTSAVTAMKTWRSSVRCKGRVQRLGGTDSYDICPLMDEYQVRLKKISIHPRSGFQFDEALFEGGDKDTQKAMKVYLRSVCRESGFEVYLKGNLGHTKKKGDTLAAIVFGCRHAQVNKKTNVANVPTEVSHGNGDKKTRHRLTTFHAPTKEEACPFVLKVFCDARDSLWYLGFSRKMNRSHLTSEARPEPCMHSNHMKMDSSVLRVSMHEIRHNCQDLLEACGEANVTSAVKANLMKIYGKFGASAITSHQMTYFQSCHDELSGVAGELDGSMSSAEKVLTLMDALIANGDDLDYCALIHEKNFEYKVRFPKGRPPKKILDVDEDRAQTIKRVRQAMGMSDDTEVLLAIAWVSGEEKELFRRFPSVISADITEKLNREQRSTFIFVGVDGNNKLFPCFRCFLPNSSLEMFNWVYEKAFIMLMNPTDVRLNTVFLTDGEFNMYYAMDLITGTSSDWSSTKTYRCRFHLLYQPWQKKVGGKPKNGSEEEIICSWVMWYIEYMMYNVIYEYQLNECIENFEDELERNASRLPRTYIAIDTLWKSMKVCRIKWARCYRNEAMDLEIGSTSSSESFNASLKKISGKKRLASSNLGASAKIQITHASGLLERREE